MFAQDVGVDAQGHGGAGVAEAGGYDVDGDSGEKQRGRVQVAQLVQPGVGEWCGRGSGRPVVCADQLGHERADRVGVERFAPPVGEDQAAVVVPGRPSGEAFCCLLAAVIAQDGDGFAVDADGAGPAALGGTFDALAAYDGCRAAEGDLGRVEIYGVPSQVGTAPS